jgi:hypothetical protein
MTLIFTPSSITRFGTRYGYAYAEEVNLSETPFEGLPATLIAWLTSQLADSESVSQIVLEETTSVAVDEVTLRMVINAAVSVTAPLGQRTFAVSSESLPTDLRDGLLAAWQSLNIT